MVILFELEPPQTQTSFVAKPWGFSLILGMYVPTGVDIPQAFVPVRVS